MEYTLRGGVANKLAKGKQVVYVLTTQFSLLIKLVTTQTQYKPMLGQTNRRLHYETTGI